MGHTSNASNVLAPCYPLTCNSEEYASSLLATQKRREELKAENRPSQGEGILWDAPMLGPYQAAVVQNTRHSLARGPIRQILCLPICDVETEICMVLVNDSAAKSAAETHNFLKHLQIKRFNAKGMQHADT